MFCNFCILCCTSRAGAMVTRPVQGPFAFNQNHVRGRQHPYVRQHARTRQHTSHIFQRRGGPWRYYMARTALSLEWFSEGFSEGCFRRLSTRWFQHSTSETPGMILSSFEGIYTKYAKYIKYIKIIIYIK